MSETPPRGIEPLTATATPSNLGIDGSNPGVSAVAGASGGNIEGAPPRPLPPRPGGSVPAPPRPSRIPVSSSSPPPRPSTAAPPPRASNPPIASSMPAVPAPPAMPAIDGVLPVPAAAAEPAAPLPLPRRRSRRTVKTEDDTMPSSEAQLAPPEEAAAVAAFAPSPEPLAPVEPPPAPVAESNEYEVIRPMRIFSVGEDLPPVKVMSEPPPPMPSADTTSKPRGPSVPPLKAVTEEVVEEGWTPRPPEVAAITAAFASETAQASFVAPPAVAPPAPAPAPPEEIPTPVEAKEASPSSRTRTLDSSPELVVEVAEEEDDEEVAAAALAEETKADEVETFEEIEVERISEVGRKAAAAEAQAQAQGQAFAPKKPPPPPPPRRAAPTVPEPSVAAAAAPTSLPPPKAAAPPPPPATAQPAPPPPAAAAPAKPVSLPEPSRRRQRPWWEDLFDDDFIRTMDHTDAKVIRREADFIESCLGLEKGATILDLACGTGRHAVELASRGYGVVGYDLSLNMLALAADEAQGRSQKLNFLQGDMREMAFDQVFDGLYSWATSFGYFDDDKNLDVLRRMHRALRIGGILVLDIINRDYVAPRQPSLVWFEGDGCVCMDEMQVDSFTSRLKVKRTAMFDDGRSREIDYSIRLYALHEIGKMMHDADFKVVEVSGHPAHPGVFFGSESPRLIIVAERK